MDNKTKKWIRIPVTDLQDAIADQTLKSLVPNAPGVYLWRRTFRSSADVTSTRASFIEWINDCTSQPNAAIKEVQLNHCVKASGLLVGGGGLTPDKLSTLEKYSSNHKFRKFVYRYLEKLDQFTPPVYIGEANDLEKRVKQHLNGDTGLEDYISSDLRLAWKDFSFHFYTLNKSAEVKEATKSTNELLEFISQRLLSPYGTKRPG